MRRVVVTIFCIALVLSLSGVASATPVPGSAHLRSETLSVPDWLHRAWFQWAFGGSTAPLLNPELCGEQVGSVFNLTLAGGVKADDLRHLSCEIPRDVPILAPIGGAVVWSNTFSDQQFHHQIFRLLERLVIHSVHIRVDGEEVDHGALVAPDPYTLALEPGNLIQTVDPTITGDSVRIDDGWYFVLLAPLSAGPHVIVTTDKFDYARAGVLHYRTRFSVEIG
jgi:hypothetical protein